MAKRISSNYVSDVYLEFKSLKGANAEEIIRFYEGNKNEIFDLELENFFELESIYLVALFENQDFKKFLSKVDACIETSIYHNFVFINHENIYNKLLFLKAEAARNSLNFEQADYILKQLFKIDPYQERYYSSFRKTRSKMIPIYLKNTRAVSILLFIFSATVIAMELLIIRNFYPNLVEYVEVLRSLLFGAGWTVLILGELIHYWKVESMIKGIKSESKKAKSFKQE